MLLNHPQAKSFDAQSVLVTRRLKLKNVEASPGLKDNLLSDNFLSAKPIRTKQEACASSTVDQTKFSLQVPLW